MEDYKKKVKSKLYKNYFTRLHSTEKDLEYTSTKLTYADLMEFFKKNGKKRLLDAGCGDGLFIAEAERNGFYCEGFDNNDELLEVCRKKGMKVRYGNFSEKLPFKDGIFDGVFCSNVFEHLEEPEFALSELLRITKKGGIVFVTVPEGKNSVFYNDWTHKTHFTTHTFKHIMMCFDVSGYKIYRRHFPVLVRHWKNPLVRFGNFIMKKGPIAHVFTSIFEKTFSVLRHDLILEIRK